MIEKTIFGLLFAICVVLLVRMALKPAHQHRLDTTVRRSAQALRRFILACWRWPMSRRRAARAADEAIRRARGNGQDNGNGHDAGNWEGNVYKPKSFKRPRKPH